MSHSVIFSWSYELCVSFNEMNWSYLPHSFSYFPCISLLTYKAQFIIKSISFKCAIQVYKQYEMWLSNSQVMVKLPCNRIWRPTRLWDIKASTFSRQLAHRWWWDYPVTGYGGPQGCETSELPHFPDSWLTGVGEVVSLTSLLSFTHPGRFLTIFFRAWDNPRGTVQLKGLCQ
jgi:hypothetical protein